MNKRALRIVVLVTTVFFSMAMMASSSVCDAVAGNLVANCGFETGTLSGWTTNLAFDQNTGFNHVATLPYSGNYGLSIGNYTWQALPIISQAISDTPGQTYTFSFWAIAGAAGNTGIELWAYWNGATILDIPYTSAPAAWTQYTFTVTGTGADTIAIGAYNDPSEYYVDDVVVKGVIPEPGSLMLLGSGILAVAGAIRRKLF